MGGRCCKDSPTGGKETEVNLQQRRSSLSKGPRKVKVQIRRTVLQEDVGASADDVEARRGSAEPDLDRLRQEADERQRAKAAKAHFAEKSGSSLGSRTSFSDTNPEEIPRNQDEPLVVAKRCQGRKGTGFVKQSNLPVAADEDDGDSEKAPKRVAGRKGTGFVKKSTLPVDEDDE